jgi:hypothetical protein
LSIEQTLVRVGETDEGEGMKLLGGIWLVAACIALLVAPAAEAHKLTKKKAEAALEPVAQQISPQVTQKIATLLPGATISKTRVDCEVAKNGHRANCSIDFLIAGASTGETACSVPARVRFRSKTSKELRVSTAPALACVFVSPLE